MVNIVVKIAYPANTNMKLVVMVVKLALPANTKVIMVVCSVPTTPPSVHLVRVKDQHPLLAGTVTVPTAIPVNTKMNLVKHPVIRVRQENTKMGGEVPCAIPVHPDNIKDGRVILVPVVIPVHQGITVVLGLIHALPTPFVHPARINRRLPLLPRTVSVPIASPENTKVVTVVHPVMCIHMRHVHREGMNRQSLFHARIATPEHSKMKMVVLPVKPAQMGITKVKPQVLLVMCIHTRHVCQEIMNRSILPLVSIAQ